MQPSSGWAASRGSGGSGQNQRVHYRHPIHSLVYVTLEQGNGGIIRNLSEDGAAIQAVGPLEPHQSLRILFDLLSPKTRVDVHAKVAWANPSGQAGLCFLDLDPGSRRQLNEWIFLHLLRGAEQASRILNGPGGNDDLILSGSARPAIRLPGLAVLESTVREPPDMLSFPWWPRPVSTRTLARLMDGLVVFSAVLMFFCAFLAVAHTLPPWEVALGLLVGAFGFFSTLYWCLFAVMGRGTAGVRLARIAGGDADAEANLREREARFR